MTPIAREPLRASARCAVLLVIAACGGGGSDPTSPTPPPPPPPAPVASVELSPATATVVVGATQQFQATARDAQGNVLAGRSVAWSSSPTTVATVTPGGLMTAVAPGPATVMATVDGRIGTATVTVTPPLPAPACRDCLEVVPGNLLLTTVGAQQQLAAYLVDGAGTRTPVNASYTSAKPGTVSVTPGGLATAVAMGSAQLTAQAGGRTSGPILALVAAPLAGTLLVGDDQVEAGMVPLDPAVPYGPGWRYRVVLRGVGPAVGQGVIGTGRHPIAGRVVSTTPGTGNLVELVLEVVPVADLFAAFSLKETIALGAGQPAGAPASGSGAAAAATAALPYGGGGSRRSWRARNIRPAVSASTPGEVEFDLGPFSCTAALGVAVGSPFGMDAFSFSIDPNIAVEIDYSLQGLQKILFTGSIAPQLMVNPVSQLSLDGAMECQKLLRIIPLPILGVASVFIGARVALGVGFGAEVKAPVGGIGIDLFVNGSATVSAGIDRTVPGWVVGDIGGTAAGFLKPVLPVQSWAQMGQVNAAFSGFGWAEFRIGGPIEETQATLLESQVGLRQKASLASELNQATDPQFASGFELDFFAEAKTGTSLELVGAFLGTDLLEFSTEHETPLARSPRGTFLITPPQVRPGSPTALGEMTTFAVSLLPVTYLGLESVESVEFRWLRLDGQGQPFLANGRPGCTSVAPAAPGQFAFTCQTDFLDTDLGPQNFHAFVKAKLFGVTVPVLLEIGPDAKATVVVQPVSVSITPSQVSVAPGATTQFAATVTGAANTAVTWSATGGTISAAGLHTAGSAAGTFAVIATSVADPTKSAAAVVTIAPPTTPPPTPSVGLQIISSSSGGKPVSPIRYRARVTNLPGVTVQWTASAVGNGTGFFPNGPIDPSRWNFGSSAPQQTSQYVVDWLAELVYGSGILIPGVTTGVAITVRACYFQPNGLPLRNAFGDPICHLLTSNF